MEIKDQTGGTIIDGKDSSQRDAFIREFVKGEVPGVPKRIVKSFPKNRHVPADVREWCSNLKEEEILSLCYAFAKRFQLKYI